jgi:hypothetical protein
LPVIKFQPSSLPSYFMERTALSQDSPFCVLHLGCTFPLFLIPWIIRSLILVHKSKRNWTGITQFLDALVYQNESRWHRSCHLSSYQSGSFLFRLDVTSVFPWEPGDPSHKQVAIVCFPSTFCSQLNVWCNVPFLRFDLCILFHITTSWRTESLQFSFNCSVMNEAWSEGRDKERSEV